ncbi:MAG: flagellar hook-basal body complex protein [Sulfuricurvum sp.]|uniref:flagellar hook-basal body complex protein n=1 Tax=Sulfuricurvum sp. TaxID=2025608 RepID=UPI00273429DC|nr:flagellar hook-basal body complex protein [Sulfuricurvum sp.]MDP2850052.1 flagellar hook-basal body complex protein [Sulfuricurvum sp.]
MNQAYFSGISGVMTHQYGLDVVADNLANVNTVGFKGSTAEFTDLFSNMLVSAGASTPTTNDIGIGSRLQSTTTQMQNGTLLSSDRFNDLAISGNGWFGVVSGNNSYYTRAGNFVFDEYQKTAGDPNSSVARLTTTDGKYVTGTMLSNFAYNGSFDYGDFDLNGVTGAYVVNDPTDDVALGSVDSQGILEFPTRIAYPVEPTTQAQFFGNLGTDNATRTISADVVSANNERNRLSLSFTLSAVQPLDQVAWDVVATVTSNDGSTVYDTKNGQAIFNGTGGLSSFNIASMDNDGTPVALDLGSGFDGVISIDGTTITGTSRSNGVSGGTLTKYGINSNGVIVADFSNGRQSAIGRIAVYHFQNDQGLNRSGDNTFESSADSGEPIFWTNQNGEAVTGSLVYSGKLENSNVRLDVGLTDMIIMQRAYQANAKCITTGDELIQKALQMHGR